MNPVSPRILEPTPANVARAIRRLAAGGLVAFPTETVYGLGGDAMDARAIAAIFAAKGRPADRPLIAHVHDVATARRLASRWPATAESLAAACWPGPLTLVVPRDDSVPSSIAGGRRTVAVRCPRHPVARALLAAFGRAIAAPSANRFGHVSPTTAEHVRREFDSIRIGDDPLEVLDGGPCAVGIESTVVDCSGDPDEPPRILRPGSIDAATVRSIVGEVRADHIEGPSASPGTGRSHYAPSCPATLLDRAAIRSFVEHRSASSGDRAALAVLSFEPALIVGRALVRVLPLPADPEACARVLYATLRAAEDLAPDRILIERPPEDDPRWNAVLDRLERATASDDDGPGALQPPV